MKKAAPLIFVATLCFSLFSFLIAGLAIGEAADAPRIPKEELKALLNDQNTIIIDVRQQGDWQESDLKIKGAVREDPMQEETSWAKKYSKDKNIVLYCS